MLWVRGLEWTFCIFCANEKRDTPLILVTGALGDERAAECIREGIADYILKDRLERLPIAILRALENKRLRDERQEAEALLRAARQSFGPWLRQFPQPLLSNRALDVVM
jgi:DNA-binding NtrC family response regulator